MQPLPLAQVNQKELTYVPPAQKEAQAGVRAALGPAYEQARCQIAHATACAGLCNVILWLDAGLLLLCMGSSAP